MVPAASPLPTARNFPFQPAIGSHTSDLMSESGVGAIVICTRQNARGTKNGGALLAVICVPVTAASERATSRSCTHASVAITSWDATNTERSVAAAADMARCRAEKKVLQRFMDA